MEEFIDEECVPDNEFGWIPPLLSRRMAEAAWAVLKNNNELNDFLKKESITI